MSVDDILREFSLFALGTGGIGSWLCPDTDSVVRERIAQLEQEPLSHSQLNQLLVIGREAPLSSGFFEYYWLSEFHAPYNVTRLPEWRPGVTQTGWIVDRSHLRWGLYRLFTDSLLFFGNVRAGYRFLRGQTRSELGSFFSSRAYDDGRLRKRGRPLPMRDIAKDNRYLVSEMACKSFGDAPGTKSELRDALFAAFREHKRLGGGGVTIKMLLSGEAVTRNYGSVQQELLFSADERLSAIITTDAELQEQFESMSDAFLLARESAIENTKLYLSMVSDLDVYVATSMRTREDFRRMADTCDRIFGDSRLQELNIRYFDPTMSGAAGHEDKGLIECLMVKAAKALVYIAGDKESYGKDAEAAMALSQGKPVVFFCNSAERTRFYREVHPLSRLIDFATGVAVGAMATDREDDVAELLFRILSNSMDYELQHPRPGYLRLHERVTNSVVRLQTNDTLLTEAFWNHYHESGSR
jgi:hypothetical protein